MNKSLINHHIHSNGSDGRCSPSELAEAALKKRLSFICFVDHNPRPYAQPWGEEFFSKEYLDQIRKVQKKFKGKLDISFGIEIDWTEEHQEFFKQQIKQFKFDYVLGSVHLIKGDDGEYFGINFSKDIFVKGVSKMGIERIVREYYRQIRLAVDSELFDCMAHLDVIKCLNLDNQFFNEKDNFYREEVIKTLDKISEKGIAIEINTSGLIYGCKSMFPSEWILVEANKRKIPITIGADTHWVERIDAGLEEAYELARKVGYKEILKFKNRKPIKIKI